ncbi:hypothetical protein MBLNU457_4285t1 [Dothideomycetes sp. NU457]
MSQARLVPQALTLQALLAPQALMSQARLVPQAPTLQALLVPQALTLQPRLVPSAPTLRQLLPLPIQFLQALQPADSRAAAQHALLLLSLASSRLSSVSSVISSRVSSASSVISSRASSLSSVISSARATTTTASSTHSAAPACATNLSGEHQYPHLIVPVNSSSPSTAYGTKYNGMISSSVSSIFNFDIPSSYAGKTCSVVFLFPTQAQLQTSSFSLSGSGSMSFASLTGPADKSTTWANKPAHNATLSTVNAQPGNSYVVATGPCAAGKTVGYEVSASGSYSLNYFQDYNPSPIGLYITQC